MTQVAELERFFLSQIDTYLANETNLTGVKWIHGPNKWQSLKPYLRRNRGHVE